MKKITGRRMITMVLTAVFVVSLVGTGVKLFQYWQGDQVYEEAEVLANVPDFTSEVEAPSSDSSGNGEENTAPVYVDPYADALKNMDFAALREVNDDVLGWIVIPDTRLSYPLVQGEDNDYYLRRTWRKYRNSVGAIFVEWQCSPDLSDFNTIIYGHRVNNRSMFGILLDYKKLSYWEKHPRLYITDDNGSHVYDIFAAYEAELDGPTYWLNVNRQSEKQEFIDYCLEKSVIDTGIVPTINDQIVTLSTCTGNGHATRWVVQGVRWGEAQEPMLEEAVAEEMNEEIEVVEPVVDAEETPGGTAETAGEELPETELEHGESQSTEEPDLQEEPELDSDGVEEEKPKQQIEA